MFLVNQAYGLVENFKIGIFSDAINALTVKLERSDTCSLKRILTFFLLLWSMCWCFPSFVSAVQVSGGQWLVCRKRNEHLQWGAQAQSHSDQQDWIFCECWFIHEQLTRKSALTALNGTDWLGRSLKMWVGFACHRNNCFFYDDETGKF